MPTPRTVAPAVMALALFLPTARAAEVDPYAPADSEWVLHLNLKQLAAAPAVKKYAADQLRTGLGESDVFKPLAALGLDPVKDVASVTAVGSGLLKYEQALLIVRGPDGDAVRQAADGLVKRQPALWKALKQGDATVYEWRDKGGKALAYVAVRADGTVLLSAGKKYLAAAAVRDPKKPAKVSEALRKLVDKADAKDDLWLASVKSESIQRVLAKSPYTAGIANDLTAFTGRLAVGDDITIAFTVHTRGKKTAEEVAQLLDAAKGLASLAAQNAGGVGPLLSDLINACKTSTDGGTATLGGQLTEAQIAKALKKK